MAINFSINIIGVALATIASFIFGWIWYGPIFGKVWAKENNIKGEQKMEPVKLLYHFLTTLLMVVSFSMLLDGIILNGLMMGVVIWAGFLLSTRLGSMIWMKQSWKLFWIDVSYHLINIAIIVVVLGLLN